MSDAPDPKAFHPSPEAPQSAAPASTPQPAAPATTPPPSASGSMPAPSAPASPPPPAGKKFWGPWASLGLTAAVVLLYFALSFAVSIVFAVIYLLQEPGLRSDQQALEAALAGSYGLILSITLLVSNPVCIACILALTWVRAPVRDSLALRPVQPRRLLPWIGAVLVFAVGADLLTIALGRAVVPEFMREVYLTAVVVPLLWIALLVAAPLFEEILFRGFLFRGLEGSRLGVPGALVLTSLSWSVIHLQYGLYEIAIILLGGLLLGLARVRTGSIVPCLVMHAAMNLIALVEAAIVVGRG